MLYDGVLGARAAWRPRLGAPDFPVGARDVAGHDSDAEQYAASKTRERLHPNRLWAELMQRSFGFDVLACPRCGGRLRLIALVEEARVIRRILDHLGSRVFAPPLPSLPAEARQDATQS